MACRCFCHGYVSVVPDFLYVSHVGLFNFSLNFGHATSLDSLNAWINFWSFDQFTNGNNHFQGFPVVFQVQSVTLFHINDAKMNTQKTTGFGPWFANVVWTMQFRIYREKNIRCGPLSFLLIRCLYEQIMINKRWNWNPNECIDSAELITPWGSNGHWHAHQHLSDLSYGIYWRLRQRLDVFDGARKGMWSMWSWTSAVGLKILEICRKLSRYQEIFCMKTYKNTNLYVFLSFLCVFSAGTPQMVYSPSPYVMPGAASVSAMPMTSYTTGMPYSFSTSEPELRWRTVEP